MQRIESASTPKGRSPARIDADAALADAYRNLEYSLPDLRRASILLETMQSDALDRPEPVAGNDDICRFDLTRDQWDGLVYAIHHIGNLARDLEKLYFAGFDSARQQTAQVAA